MRAEGVETFTTFEAGLKDTGNLLPTSTPLGRCMNPRIFTPQSDWRVSDGSFHVEEQAYYIIHNTQNSGIPPKTRGVSQAVSKPLPATQFQGW